MRACVFLAGKSNKRNTLRPTDKRHINIIRQWVLYTYIWNTWCCVPIKSANVKQRLAYAKVVLYDWKRTLDYIRCLKGGSLDCGPALLPRKKSEPIRKNPSSLESTSFSFPFFQCAPLIPFITRYRQVYATIKLTFVNECLKWNALTPFDCRQTLCLRC